MKNYGHKLGIITAMALAAPLLGLKLTKEFLESESEIDKVEYNRFGETNTHCTITAKSGFTFTGESACDQPEIRLKDMAFGSAITAMKDGHHVARSGWNGKGMFLSLVKGRDTNYHVNSEVFGTGNDGNSQYQLPVLDAIYMKTADNKLVPWLASQTDVLAEDWQIVE